MVICKTTLEINFGWVKLKYSFSFHASCIFGKDYWNLFKFIWRSCSAQATGGAPMKAISPGWQKHKNFKQYTPVAANFWWISGFSLLVELHLLQLWACIQRSGFVYVCWHSCNYLERCHTQLQRVDLGVTSRVAENSFWMQS